MKGTLHKTESGWQVWYHAKEDLYYGNTGVRILPLIDNGHIDGLKLYDSNEGLEVDFEIVEFPVPPTNGPVSNSISIYAKLVDNWLTIKEGDITVNFKPMPEFDEPEYPTRVDQLRKQTWDTIIREFHLATQKVEMGAPPLIFECWLVDNYNPPTKKQD
jgi:hypothetical protein